MKTHDITQSAVRLQRATDALSRAFQRGHHGRLHLLVVELRLATVQHAQHVTELVETATQILGRSDEVRLLPELIDHLFNATGAIREELASPRQRCRTYTVARLSVVVDELIATEQALFCGCGSILFPAETW